ncbi:TPA: AAA family ATPase [Enterobacter ludwigii]|nr:AAA family ATPase [Enterobacter ludwigii]
MFIKKLKIENFKGYHGEDNELEFNIPDGETEGSGLNIFVGENNAGKSTVFEIIDFIKDGTKKNIEDLICKSDPANIAEKLSAELTFTGNLSEVIAAHVQANKVAAFTSHVFEDEGVNYFRVKRCSEVGEKKILFWNGNEFVNPSGIDAPFKKFYDNNFIWADTNPSNEAKFGSTTICGSLLKEIALGHIETDEYRAFSEQYHRVFNHPESELRQKISLVEDQVRTVFSSQFGMADISFIFEELQVENFFKTISIMIDDGVNVPMGEKGHGMQRALALSLLQVYADITCNAHGAGISKPFYLFIDEPEICLHPSGQQKLLEALMIISKSRQVFVTTHSPFLLSSPYLKNVGLFVFKKENNKNVVERADTSPWFPWSPSWGEINFKAYNLATVELHNELYGYLQEKNSCPSEKAMEQWLNSNGIAFDKVWVREFKGAAQPPADTTLQTFIRNHIHHPENVSMQSNRYTQQELLTSIQQMVGLL